MSTPREYTCDVQVMGQGWAKNVVVWLSNASQLDAKKAAGPLFPGKTIGSVTNVKLKK